MTRISRINFQRTESFIKNGLIFFNKTKIYEEQRAVFADSVRLFLADYQAVFKLKTHTLLPKAIRYLQGLLQTERSKRNIERMVEHTDSNYQSQQQFISDLRLGS